MQVNGGEGGTSPGFGGRGGAGSIGRIRVEYCESLAGSTNPPASTNKLNCYIADQSTDATRGMLNLPAAGTNTYQVQYGRRYTFAAAGQDTKQLRMKRQVYSAASLDALINNTGAASGNLDLCLDIGADGSCDYHPTSSQTFPATLSATGLATALNTYLLGRTDIAWGGDVNVPVRVQVDRQADVMLTNLALTPVGAKTRFLRLPAEAYSDLTLSLKLGQAGTPAGALAFTVDVGADGVVDWSYSGSHSFPVTLSSPNLATAFNSYLAGRTGDVDVPIRIVPSPSLETALANFTATPSARPELTLTPSDISFNPPAPVETDEITVSALLRNAGSRDSGPVIASFFATPPGGREWYIGSTFVANVTAGGVATTPLPWVTTGFTGDVPVRVVIDPFNRVAETNENNNQASKTLTIKTRPDLRLTAITPADPEPVAGETVQVSLPLRNDGQTAAGPSVLALYDGNPANGGALICEILDVTVPGNGESSQICAWTPAAPGLHRLFAVADRDRAVNEADESNNQGWQDVYVGFAGPILVDSGGASDPSYTAAGGYGYLNGSASEFCGADPLQSQRTSANGKVEYRFDHLLPGHFYHLDLTLVECDGIGRLEQVYIDGNRIGDPAGYDLSSGDAVYPSLRLDPALYTTGSIVVAVQELNGNDAVVAEISLHDIDYRYLDSGKSSNPSDPADPRYPYARPGRPERRYGWLDGVDQRPLGWGTLPYQTRRIDLGDSDASDNPDNELRYQFDGLQAGLRYQVHLTFYQKTGSQVVQAIAFDEYDTGVTVDFTGEARKDVTVDVPPGAYADDGSIVLKITRTDGATANAFVNEVALEQLTSLAQRNIQPIPLHTGWNWMSFYVKPPVQPAPNCTGVTPTSAFTNMYGEATLAGQPVPAGTIVEAFTPAGVKVGCFKVTDPGLFGYMRVYGAEGGTPGMQPGEPIRFRINGIAAPSTPDPLIWQDDRADHAVDLAAPDVIPVSSLLSGIEGKYSRVLCENGTYLPPPANPVFNTCTTMEPGRGYLIYMTETATLTLTGPRVATDSPLPLHSGWNWLGYLPTCTLNVPTALPSIDSKFTYLHGETGTYRPPPANPAFNTLTNMGPGRGYMLHMTQAAALIYPANLCGAAQNQAIAEPETSACPAIPTSQFTSFYGRIASAAVPLPAGAGILAYSPRGEVVGCGVVQEDGLYGYLRVYGADGDLPGMLPEETVTFTIGGLPAGAAGPARWQNDFEAHEQDLSLSPYAQFLPLVGR